MSIPEKHEYLSGLCDTLSRRWPDNRTVNLVCHGHSVPSGYACTPMVDPFHAYPHLMHRTLAQRFPYAVINVIVTAVGGENSVRGAARFRDEVLCHRPDLVTIDYGLNDRGVTLQQAEASWRQMTEDALERNIPVIFINGYYRKLRNIPHVVMDDYGGGCQAAREILRRGYVRPAGMFKTDDLQGQEREAGLTDELRSRGISIPEECMLRFGTEHRMDLFETREGMDFVDTLASGKADCVVCYNDVFASNLMERLRQKGVKLPEDLGIIGFDNSVHAAMNRPALTTLGHPMETFGELTALKILNMIDGEKEKSVRMPWTLIERDSLPDRNR